MNVTLPTKDEFELSIFGAGTGECLVLHAGFGDWVVVDSHLDEGGEPVALTYLQSIGVDVAKQVKLVGITHWHDDHCQGVASLFEACKSAKFACSAALNSQEFYTLAFATSGIEGVRVKSGIEEFRGVLNELQRRNRNAKPAGPDKYCVIDREIYRSPNASGIRIECVSPTDQAVTESNAAFAKLMPEVGQPLRKIRYNSPNDTSVAMIVRRAGANALLGADLTIGVTSKHGWRAFVSNKALAYGRFDVFKIPHHGSVNAHHEGLWDALFNTAPISAITTYACSHLPRPEQLNRIYSRSSCVVVTTEPRTKNPKRRAGVEREINQRLKNRSAAPKQVGHIRIRCRLDAIAMPDDVSLYGKAVEIEKPVSE